MKRIVIMYMAVCLLTGCSGRITGWQTGDVALAQTVGADLTEQGVRVGVAVGLQGDTGVLRLADGATMAEGVQRLRGLSGGLLHFGHVEQLLLGEALAQNGIGPVLDFIARDRQLGPGVRLWVLKGDSAERALASGGANVSARLEQLGRNEAEQKVSCTATRLMSVMAREGSVPVPALRLEGDALRPDGYGVLHRGRLVGFLDAEQSLGLELLCGQGGGQQVDMTLPEGTQLALAVKRGRIAVEPVFGGGLAGVTLRCAAQLDVVQGAELTEELRRQVIRTAQAVLRERISGAVARAQFWGTDYVGLEQMLRAACSEWEWKKEDWVAEFRALSVEVEVDVQVEWPADIMEENNHG